MAKDKKVKIPKEVGGVKVPKKLRKSAGVVAELARNPLAREVVSAALVAGTAVLAKRTLKRPAAAVAAAAEPKKSGNDIAGLIAQGSEFGAIVAQGVTAFLGALVKPAEKDAAPPAEPAGAKPGGIKTGDAKPAAAKPARAKPTPRAAAAKSVAPKPATRKPAAAKPATAIAKPRAKPGPKPKPASH